MKPEEEILALSPDTTASSPDPRRTGVTGALLGVGLAGTLDEVVLHQLLGWHHFYDRSGSTVGLISDGLFHLFSTGVLVLGMYRLWRLERNGSREWKLRTGAGIALGAGGFNLYDGIVQHKLLGLHQIRPEAPSQLPYDLVFNAVALLLLAAGLALLRRSTGE